MRETVRLYEHQKSALRRMSNGCILDGGTGSGKSITAVAYFFENCGGMILDDGELMPMVEPKMLYVITTAKKRDSREWEYEILKFNIDPNFDNVVIDSWNNITKYTDVEDAFFIFDEQRAIGSGTWAKSFIKIAKKNEWILLSATPGDCWMDYAPVFIANGFYKNFTEFKKEHVVYSRFSKFPRVERYLATQKLNRLRRSILVDMDFKRTTKQIHEELYCGHSTTNYKVLMKDRINPSTGEPIVNASELCYELRKICNSDPSRIAATLGIIRDRCRCIIFYNFDYELELLKQALDEAMIKYAECNGHRHDDIPEGSCWVYLVQYTAGAEGWNCTTCDTIIFYSQSYSYKATIQAAGRIDRLNTPYEELYYFHLKSRSGIDLAIGKALGQKKKFNEKDWIGQ